METIRARWADGAFVPVGNYSTATCHDELSDGEVVALTVEHSRSGVTHRHQFAWLHEAWANLPDQLMGAPYAANSETLRKHALIATGFCDVETIDAGSKAAAERVATYVGALARKAHGYALVTVTGPLVRCYTPRSQSHRAMPGGEFQKSKEAILQWVAGLLEVPAEDLRGAA